MKLKFYQMITLLCLLNNFILVYYHKEILQSIEKSSMPGFILLPLMLGSLGLLHFWKKTLDTHDVLWELLVKTNGENWLNSGKL